MFLKYPIIICVIEFLKSTKNCLSYSFKYTFKISFMMMFLGLLLAMVPYVRVDSVRFLINTIDNFSGNNFYTSEIFFALLFLSATVVIPEILTELFSYITKLWKFKLSEEFEVLILKKRIEIPISKYEDSGFQNLMQRAFHKGHSPLIDFSEQQFEMIRPLVSFVIGSVLAIGIHPLGFLILFMTSIPGLIVQFKYGAGVWNIRHEDSPEQRRFLDLKRYFTNLYGIVEIKLFQITPKLINWIKTILRNFHTKHTGLHKRRVLSTLITEVVFFAGYISCLYLVLIKYSSTRLMIGDLIFSIGVLNGTKFAIYNLFSNIIKQYEEHLSVKDILEFLMTESDIKNKRSQFELKDAPEVVFENVWFKYPASNKWILKDVSFKIDKQQMVAFTGANGSGKSTILKLLCKIYEPSSGEIFVDGIDLRNIDRDQWWAYLGVMNQEYQNYKFVISDAIAIGDIQKEIERDKIIECAKLSTANSFIEKWSTEYQTQLGVVFGGKELSRGQKQKLALAKVLYRNSFLTVLDEPTASIDMNSVQLIAKNLFEIRKNKTLIIVSHDPKMTENCDQTFHLEDGSVEVLVNDSP